ncbi:MAG: segregation and condensation protein B, partial [Thermoproteota archaeon]
MENTQEQTVDFMFKWDLETNEFSEPDKFELELEHFDEKEQEDKFWMARTGLNLDTLAGAIETIVFMSDKPVSIIKIKNQIDEELPLRVVHEAITRLQSEYEEKHHGIRLQEVAEGYQYRTKATYSKFVQSLFKVNSLVLSPTALEVLAIIAYKQPVSKMDVEQIRGVDSSHIIRGLMDKRLVKMSGRSEEVGRPSLFGTTLEFLEVFNLPNISELPSENELEELAEGNTVGAISDIKGIVGGEKDKFNFDEMEELETLSKDINNISSDTFFTKTLNFENKQKVKAPKEGEETPVRRSAFEILEEFVNNDASLKQNQEAALSETPMNVIDARIVDVTLELSEEHGLIN